MTTPEPQDEVLPLNLAQQLGRILSQARTDKGLSMNAMARQLGVAVPTLHQYEHGRGNPTLTKVQDLAEQYGVQLEIRLVPAKRAARKK
ncbi:helix-turn-helix domain-containing protein [Kribbella catacumbae]|uniref:helix-turn-helix domain-containing protein n=1 Tax=Kribbella catacumbae TaxID=460086 RepID=UPI00036A8915|nr:helix-turn-helix transcriptional regulator [Kribbella catacumbae]